MDHTVALMSELSECLRMSVGALERLYVPSAPCPVSRQGELDTEPTRGDTGEGNVTSRSQGHATKTPHECCGMGVGATQGLLGRPHTP